MDSQKIIESLEQLAPLKLAEPWDNPGFQIGRAGHEVSSVFLALDATKEVIDRALDCKADMLITHHPLIFSGIKNILDDDFIGRRIIRLIEGEINYYAMHTNFDVAVMAKYAATLLDLHQCKVLKVTHTSSCGEMSVEMGIGCTGLLKEPMSLKDCAEWAKKVFCIPNVKIYGDLGAMIQRVSVSPGSGKGMSEAAIRQKAEVLITGDIGHHEGIDAIARGIFIIDAGHHGIEHIFVDYMKSFFKENWSDIKVYTEDNISPFTVI